MCRLGGQLFAEGAAGGLAPIKVLRELDHRGGRCLLETVFIDRCWGLTAFFERTACAVSGQAGTARARLSVQ